MKLTAVAARYSINAVRGGGRWENSVEAGGAATWASIPDENTSTGVTVINKTR
jgi:hypothetical protein